MILSVIPRFLLHVDGGHPGGEEKSHIFIVKTKRVTGFGGGRRTGGSEWQPSSGGVSGDGFDGGRVNNIARWSRPNTSNRWVNIGGGNDGPGSRDSAHWNTEEASAGWRPGPDEDWSTGKDGTIVTGGGGGANRWTPDVEDESSWSRGPADDSKDWKQANSDHGKTGGRSSTPGTPIKIIIIKSVEKTTKNVKHRRGLSVGGEWKPAGNRDESGYQNIKASSLGGGGGHLVRAGNARKDSSYNSGTNYHREGIPRGDSGWNYGNSRPGGWQPTNIARDRGGAGWN